MLVKYEKVEKHVIKTRPQARTIEKDAALERLSESLEQGQLQPVGLMRDGTMIWGHRRLAAAMLKKSITHLWAAVFEQEIAEGEFRRLRAVENFQRSDLTDHERWLTAEELMRVNPDWRQADLATGLSLDPGSITRLLSPGRCIPAVREALAGGLVSIADCYQFSLADEKQQHELLSLRLSGATRDEIARSVKKSRQVTAPSVKLSRVKIALPTGSVVNVAGEELSMDDVVQTLADTLKSARKALDGGYDVKTWQRMMSDKAKTGG